VNGIHDMGGMHGMGPIKPEKNEPVFHAAWEGRAFALSMAVDGDWPYGADRYQIELIPPEEYLRQNYCGRSCESERPSYPALSSRPARAPAQYESRGTYATTALHTRQNRDDRAEPWRFRIPGHQRQGLGEKPQHVYSVRFAARDLWGEQASRYGSIYVDLWDDYLEPA
jgi:nitrile hydratase subunit beta